MSPNKAAYSPRSIPAHVLKHHCRPLPTPRKRGHDEVIEQPGEEGSNKRRGEFDQAGSPPGLLTNKSDSEIQYMFSKAQTCNINQLGYMLSHAVKTSNLWKKESERNEPASDCVTTIIPEGENEDVSINLWVGRADGLALLSALSMVRTWSSSPTHQSLPP